MNFKGGYIYPPRPEKIHPDDLDSYDNGEWVAQLKFNDTRNLIIVTPSGEVELFTRHNTKHSKYHTIHPKLREAILKLNHEKNKYQVYDSLLLHTQSKLFKDTIILLDVLVLNDEYLYGTSVEERYNLLKKICTPKIKNKYAYVLSEHLWMIQNFSKNFTKIYNKWKDQFSKDNFIEGLVLKRKKGTLNFHYNTDKCNWMFKARYTSKKYLF